MVIGFSGGGGAGGCRLKAMEYLALPCLLCFLSPLPRHSYPHPQPPFYYSNWEQNIWTQHCFWACSCIPSTLLPPLCGALTSPLGLSKNKESLQGREWVGTAYREYAEPQMWGSSVQCASVILESHDNLTLPVLIALKALKKYAYSFPVWKMFRTFKKALKA